MVVSNYSICVAKRIILVMTLVTLLAPVVLNQGLSDKHKVRVKTKFTPEKVSTGGSAKLHIFLTIDEGWHLNSSAPLDENLIETSIQIDVLDGFKIVGIEYPNGVEKIFTFSEAPVDIFEGTIEVVVKLDVAPDVSPAIYKLPVSVNYQACDDNICLAPASVTTQVIVDVISAVK